MVERLQETVLNLGELALHRGTRCDKRYVGNFFAIAGLRMFTEHVTKTINEAELALQTSEYAALEPDIVEHARAAVAIARSSVQDASEKSAKMDRYGDTDKDDIVLLDQAVDDALAELLRALDDEVFGARVAVPGAEETVAERSPGDISLQVHTLSGAQHLVECPENATLFDLKRLLEMRVGVRARSQKLLVDQEMLNGQAHASLSEFGLKNGTCLNLVACDFCLVCQSPCRCLSCHGEGRFNQGCATCKKVRPDCPACKGPCRCPSCHGDRRHCTTCGFYYPCWGGDTYVFLEGGSKKKIRECAEGDKVRTLLGFREITKIWASDPQFPDLNKEVGCVNGIWITAKHPIISGECWASPCDLVATAPWRKRRHVMPDMFSFELQGHDDTIVLWGGGENLPVVSCTLGKYLGENFKCDVWTRRSSQCQGPCAQCDAVFIPGISFDRKMKSSLRGKIFPSFPQVEWENSERSEFELAVDLLKDEKFLVGLK